MLPCTVVLSFSFEKHGFQNRHGIPWVPDMHRGTQTYCRQNTSAHEIEINNYSEDDTVGLEETLGVRERRENTGE